MFRFLILLSLVFVSACSNNKTETNEKNEKLPVFFKGNLFNPIYLSALFDSPNNFGPVWDTEKVETLKINKIVLFVKGGRYKNNLSEKLTYTFNSTSKTLDFSHFLYNVSTAPFSSSTFNYKSNGDLEKIDVNTFMQVGNIPPVFLLKDSIKTTVITSRNNNDFDSLVFYPNIEKPTLIVEILNSKINSIEIFAKKGSSRQQIREIAQTLDSSLNIFILAEKSVTFMENNLPIETIHLNGDWQKLDKFKQWEYNEYSQPTTYTERLNGTLIKSIEIKYGINNIPEELIVDRKKFIFYTVFQ